MIPVLTRAQMRAFDKYAIETCHVPGIVLMENAGRGAADVISAMIEESNGARGPSGSSHSSRAAAEARAARARDFPVRHVKGQGQPATYPLDAKVTVVCGAGNNGGDGFVVARHLLARGAAVEVFLLGSEEKVMGESRVNLDAYIDLGGAFVSLAEGEDRAPLDASLAAADFVVDAIFGTGLDRPIRGTAFDVIDSINKAGARVVALDVPSGLDADSGAPLGIAVQADDTVTFGHLKIGLLTPDGARLSGTIHVADLGVPDPPILAHVGYVAEVIQRESVAAFVAPREPDVYKHRAGDVLVIAGSAGKLGSSLLTATAALRAGAGLSTICTWPDAMTALQAHVVEVMTTKIDPDRIAASLDEATNKRKAIAIGPGLGLDDKAREAVDHVVLGWEGLKVVDADAITHFVGRPEALAEAKGQCILTPHSGELGRLLGKTASAIEQDRLGAVREAVAKTRAIVILKGARTFIALPDGRIFICMAGNPALATAGSGDALSGIIAAFACTMPADRAACAGVLVHALAGDAWLAKTGIDRGMLAGEIAEAVPGILASLRSAHG